MGEKSMRIELEEASNHLEWLQALAVSMVADHQAAEDLVQHALHEASRKKDWQPGRLKPWLAGTLRNLSRQYFRTESRRRSRELRVVEAAELRAQGVRGAVVTTPPQELAQQVESQKLLSSAVVDLPEPYRETLLLFYYGGRSQQEIAEELGISPRTVETRLRRAREKLRKRLVGQYGKESWVLGILPLIKRFPPPAPPLPIAVAGWGSLGEGWWAAGALALTVIGLTWVGQTKESPDASLDEVALVAETEASSLQSETVARNLLAEDATPPVALVPPSLSLPQDFVLQERGTGVGLEGLRLRVLFLHAASAEQRMHRHAPEFFQPQDRIWWKLGEAIELSNAQGEVRFHPPQGTTHFMLVLGTHSATHSISGYSLRFKTFERKAISGQRISLEMVRRTGTASGYVVDTQNNPLADVLVDVFFDAPRGLSKDPVMTLSTQADGSFSIPNIACDQGGFRLRPRGDLYASVQSLRMQRYAGFGADYPGISLVLTPARRQTKVLVQTENGSTIAGATVVATRAQTEESDLSYDFGTYLLDWKAEGITDQDGMAVFQELPEGALQWVVQHENYRPVELGEFEAPSNFTFTLSDGSEARIYVAGQGVPVAGASVSLFSKTQRRSGLTDAAGLVSFQGLSAEEEVHLTVTHSQYAFWQKPGWKIIGGLKTEMVELQAGHSISGKVVWDSQVAGLAGDQPRVFLRPIPEPPLTPFPMRENKRADTGWWQVAGMDEALVADDGSFEFRGLPDTDVELWFGLRRRPLGFAMAHSGDTDVHLYPGSGMSDKAIIDIHVFDELSGRPVTTYYLFWTHLDGEKSITLPATIVKNAEGRYRHLGLAPGTWSLTAWAPQGFTTKRLGPRAIAPGPQALEIPLAAARSLRLRLLNPEGQALAGVGISARSQDGNVLLQGGLLGGGFREWSTTDARGQISMSHVPETQPYQLICKYQGREHTFHLPGARVEGELRELIFPAQTAD